MCRSCKKVVALILPHLFNAGAASLASAALEENFSIADIEAQQNTADSTKLLGQMTEVLNVAGHTHEDLDRLLEAIYVEEGRDTITLTRAAKIAFYVSELSGLLARMILMAIEEKARRTQDAEAIDFALSDAGHTIRDSVPNSENILDAHPMMIHVGIGRADEEDESAEPEYRH